MGTRHGGNKYFIHKGGWNKYNITIEINISSLSWSVKNKAFNLHCEINKNNQAKTPAPPPPIYNGAPLGYYLNHIGFNTKSQNNNMALEISFP